MKVELTAAALADLDHILDYTRTHFPPQAAPLERRAFALCSNALAPVREAGAVSKNALACASFP
jgi:plasmid stabilization system protein ParE